MKGIILAGGSGTRLHPLTKVVSKQMMPIYDKPMIYYPLSTLMLAGIREILIVSTPRDLPMFEELLGDGARLGMRFQYAEQPRPDGLAQAFIIGADFIGQDPVCLILGDNLFYGEGMTHLLRAMSDKKKGATIFAYQVRDPERYGVVTFDSDGRVVSLEEKPTAPKSDYVVPGIYFYGPDVAQVAASLKPSARGELEITDLNRVYLERGELNARMMGRGIAWLDTGTHGSLLEASQFIGIIEQRTGLKVACLEEIAWNRKWIGANEVRGEIERMGDNRYADYLRKMLER